MAEVHNIKIWPEFFRQVKSGNKPFEVRKNDRDYKVGDTLILEEYDPCKKVYTGAWIPELITYKLDDQNFVKEGFVILGMKEINFNDDKKHRRR